MAGLTDRVRRRQALCAEVAVALPAYVAGETPLDARSAQHVAQCLRCQAEVARYRRMLRALHDLREDTPKPPSAVLADLVVDGLFHPGGGGAPGGEDRVRRRLLGVAVIVGVTVGAAGGAGMTLWVHARRQAVGRRSAA